MLTLFAITGSLISALIGLAVYFIQSYAIYKVAKLRFIPNAWMAFIPFLQLYMMGYIGDTLKYNHYKINAYIADIPLAYALPIASILTNVAPSVPILGGPAAAILALAVFAGELMVYYFIFSLYADPKNATIYTVLSIIPLVGPILVLYTLKDRRY